MKGVIKVVAGLIVVGAGVFFADKKWNFIPEGYKPQLLKTHLTQDKEPLDMDNKNN